MSTTRARGSALAAPARGRTWRVRATLGPDAGAEALIDDEPFAVGTAEGVSLRLSDETVSRYHLELRSTPKGLWFRDLGSTNGTHLGAGPSLTEVAEGTATGVIRLTIGETRLELQPEGDHESTPETPAAPVVSQALREAPLATQALREAPLATQALREAPLVSAFGRLLGVSPAMQAVFGVLRDAAPTSAPVLITGESGTGKELAARAIHDASPRAGRPFEVVDCGGLPPTLIESELFGHERGAFTGALTAREGAFERADGGTVFLDELGELPLELQPKLLRVLGEREVRRVGAPKSRRVDVRIVAATNRDLRQRVNTGEFRADLFFRLAVIQVRMPALRHRLDDLPILVPGLLEAIARDRDLAVEIEPDEELYTALARHAWPGNVRELRNYLEQLVILRKPPELDESAAPAEPTAASPFAPLLTLPMRAAKEQLLERFERDYIAQALERAGGNVAEAARWAGVDRGTLFRAIRRYGLGS
jgi:DNA-binding NtrC family response regulator